MSTGRNIHLDVNRLPRRKTNAPILNSRLIAITSGIAAPVGKQSSIPERIAKPR